jgi:hypothetical protein
MTRRARAITTTVGTPIYGYRKFIRQVVATLPFIAGVVKKETDE